MSDLILCYFFSCSFLVCAFYTSGQQIISLNSDHLILMASIDIRDIIAIFSSYFSWSENVTVVVCKLYMSVCKLYFYFGLVRNFGQYLYLSAYIEQWKCPKFCFRYMLYSHFTQNYFFHHSKLFITFRRLKILVLWQKIVQNFLLFVYLFCPKNSAIDFTKTFITQERLVVKSCPKPRWIAFLMLYPFVYDICSHFNELILAWSAYYKNIFSWDFFKIIYQKTMTIDFFP